MSQHSNEGEMEQFASSLIETVEKPNKSLVANHRVGSRVRHPTEQGYWHGVRDLISGSWVPGGVGCNLLSPLQWICAFSNPLKAILLFSNTCRIRSDIIIWVWRLFILFLPCSSITSKNCFLLRSSATSGGVGNPLLGSTKLPSTVTQ